MADKTYEYSKASDLGGQFDSDDFDSEIREALTRQLMGVSHDAADKVVATFAGSSDLSQADLDALQGPAYPTTIGGVLAAHVPNSLSNQKKARRRLIDDRTQELILEGFSWGSPSKKFSLSRRAQRTWMGLELRKSSLTYPINVNIKKDTEKIQLDDAADVGSFFAAATDEVRVHLDSGTVLKQSIRDAADQAALDAVVDTR